MREEPPPPVLLKLVSLSTNQPQLSMLVAAICPCELNKFVISRTRMPLSAPTEIFTGPQQQRLCHQRFLLQQRHHAAQVAAHTVELIAPRGVHHPAPPSILAYKSTQTTTAKSATSSWVISRSPWALTLPRRILSQLLGGVFTAGASSTAVLSTQSCP